MNKNKEVKAIADALHNKSKRTMRDYKSLLKQAEYFSPAYRDYILKVINNKSLTIKNGSGGYTKTIGEDYYEITKKLTKKRKNLVMTDISVVDMLPHELGHAVDFYFGSHLALTSMVVLNDQGESLYHIFNKEFEEKEKELYNLVFEEYKNIINNTINKDAYDIFINNIDTYRELSNIKVDRRNKEVTNRRRELQKKLYESGFVEVYYQLYSKKCYSLLNEKYSPILDALSSKYDFNGLFIDHHEKDYYEHSNVKPVQEFFANVFESKVTSKHSQFDNLMKLLPKSFNAFERLFVIIYDHIQNNKRFNDVKTLWEV